MTTNTGDLRDDACGDGRAGGEGSFQIDAAVGYTFGIDDGSGLGGAGAQVGADEALALNPLWTHNSFPAFSHPVLTRSDVISSHAVIKTFRETQNPPNVLLCTLNLHPPNQMFPSLNLRAK